MSEPAQTTLPLYSSLAAFVLPFIAALFCSALLALRAACVRRVRACAHASLVRVHAAMLRSALPCPALLCPALLSSPLPQSARSRSLSLSLTLSLPLR